jgi:uncharacterized protein (TIRG00374 family)
MGGLGSTAARWVPPRRAWLGVRPALIAAGVGTTLAFGYLSVRAVDVGDAWTAFQRSRAWWFVPGLATLALAVFLRIVRWRYLFAPTTRPRLGATTSAYLVGQFFNNLLPLRAGEAARVEALRRRARTSRTETAGTIVAERAYDVVCLLVLLFVLVPWLPRVSWLHDASIGAIALIGAIVVLAAVLLLFDESPLRLFLAPFRLLPGFTTERVVSMAENLGRGLTSVRGLRAALVAVVLTTVSWIVMGVAFWFVSFAFDLPRTLLLGMLVVIATNLAQVLPSAPAAAGVFEVSGVLAVTAFGAPRAVALSYAVVLHVMNFVPYLALGPFAIRQSSVPARSGPEAETS